MIHFKSIELKNFMSYGDNPTIFDLDRHSSTLISGANGLGKTSLVTGLCYSLFGKTERNIAQKGLINTVNQRDCYAKATFIRGQHIYTVLRGQKPSRLEVTKDGNLLNQDASVRDTQKFIEDLLGFDFNSFLRVMFLSTMNYTPFMQLTASERRNFVETMLDLKDFSEMSKLHRAELSRLNGELREIESKLNVDKATYNEKRNTVSLLEKIDSDRVDKIKIELKELVGQVGDKKEEIDGFKASLENVLEEIKELESSISADRTLISGNNDAIRSIDSEIRQIDSQAELVKVSKCDSCKQEVDPEHAKEILTKLNYERGELEHKKNTIQGDSEIKEESLKKKQESLTKLKSNAGGFGNDIQRLETECRIIGSEIKSKASSIDKDVDTSKIDEIKSEIKELKSTIKEGASEFDKVHKQIQIGKTVSLLLNDSGIKASIIKEYIPILVASVNQYLQKLNIGIRFNMDEEFNETIITRYSNEYTYGNLSAGERARIDLAMVFAWRDVAKLKGSVYSSILILDEILDASLDSAGTEDAMNILEEITNNGDTYVFIISHRGALDDRCRSIIQLEKVNGFSRIVK